MKAGLVSRGALVGGVSWVVLLRQMIAGARRGVLL